MNRTLVVAVVLTLVSVGGFFLFHGVSQLEDYADDAYWEMQRTSRTEAEPEDSDIPVRWVRGESWWEPIGEPPACPEPMILQPPADLTLATSVLYPGQYRGAGMEAGNYKPHGGLRFDGLAVDEVSVRLPYDASLVEMARYRVEGEVQYTLEFLIDCGVVMRLGHLAQLTPGLAVIAETLPAAAEGDSRTYVVGPLRMRQGDVVAVATGLMGLGSSPGRDNTFLDWGVYDLREKNTPARNLEWAALHPSLIEQHAVCWFSWLSDEHETLVRLLPAGSEGNISDLCD